ncbi:MAG: 3-oxoacyl-ACP reductase family protein [Actinomycetota bacterium]|nr:3-oxoacyl-ACP reductase family protein [Actinomycetota bacterium]
MSPNAPTFHGRVAIVTGGTRGIGAAISERLLREGADVFAVYASSDAAAHAFAGSVADAPGRLVLHRADIGDPAACHEIVAAALRELGRVDHLVNNAGVLVENSVRRMTVAEWDRAISVNLSASFHLAQAAIEPMTAQGFGRIVNISSITAAMGNSVEAGYGAAKAGLHGLSRSLSRAVARKGITVNVVVPGVFETDMTNDMAPEAQEAIKAMIPLGRRGDPAELAHAVMFLLDERAAYVTGSVVTVDGGISMGA